MSPYIGTLPNQEPQVNLEKIQFQVKLLSAGDHLSWSLSADLIPQGWAVSLLRESQQAISASTKENQPQSQLVNTLFVVLLRTIAQEQCSDCSEELPQSLLAPGKCIYKRGKRAFVLNK